MSSLAGRLSGAVRSWLSPLLLFAGLGAVAWWGYRTEWRLPGAMGGAAASEGAKDKSADAEAEGAIKLTPPARPPANCPLAGTRLEFPTAAAVARAGIRTAAASAGPLTETVSAPGELNYDQTLVARLSTPIRGIVWRVEKEVGDRVAKGEMVALVDAAELGKAKAELLEAVADAELKAQTLRGLETAREAVPGRQIQEARGALRVARVRLENDRQALANLGLPVPPAADLAKAPEDELARRMRLLGLPESVTRGLDPETATTNLLPIVSPLDGVVAERKVVAGEVVDASAPLFVVANLRRIWVLLDVRLEEADRIAPGQSVRFLPDGHEGEALVGKLSWISTTVDEKTRTMRARAVVDNPREHFRARTFGTAQVSVREIAQAVVVPDEAVQREGRCQFVFVRLADTVFELREVQPGARSGRLVDVHGGIRPGEVVATTGSHVLKSEVLKGRLAAEAD